jgi:hypothetical protein
VKLGTFHARDERTVQSFPLDEQLYAKYVKVLLLFIFVNCLISTLMQSVLSDFDANRWDPCKQVGTGLQEMKATTFKTTH